MGTKFCNMNIYNPSNMEYILPAGYSIKKIVNGWDTILEDECEIDFKKMEKIAKTLSKDLNTSVITVNYFDDDIFELYVTVDGRKAAYSCVSIDDRISKKVPILVEALRLNDKDAKAFRYLLKNNNGPQDAIFKISAICQLPLYIDSYIYEDLQENIVPDKNTVLDEIKKEKSRNKIKSTRPELLAEFPGDVVSYYTSGSESDDHQGIIRTVEPTRDGIDYGKVNCYQVTVGENPYLKKVFDYYIPISELTGEPKGTNIWIFGDPKDNLVFLEPPCMCHYFIDDPKKIKEIGDVGIIPKENLSNPPYDFEKIKSVSNEEFPEEPNPELAKVKDSDIYTDLFCLSLDMYIIDGFIIRVSEYNQYKKHENSRYARFDLFDDNKKFIKTVLIPIEQSMKFRIVGARYTYLPERNLVIYDDFVVDLKDRTIIQNENLPKSYTFIEKRTVNGKKLLIFGTSRYVQIFDHDFNRLCAYSVVGKFVNWFYDAEDNMYVITSSIIHGADDRGMIEKDRVRMYKLPLALYGRTDYKSFV